MTPKGVITGDARYLCYSWAYFSYCSIPLSNQINYKKKQINHVHCVEWNCHYFFLFICHILACMCCLLVLPYYMVNKDEYIIYAASLRKFNSCLEKRGHTFIESTRKVGSIGLLTPCFRGLRPYVVRRKSWLIVRAVCTTYVPVRLLVGRMSYKLSPDRKTYSAASVLRKMFFVLQKTIPALRTSFGDNFVYSIQSATVINARVVSMRCCDNSHQWPYQHFTVQRPHVLSVGRESATATIVQ